jgi:hypothetical protein
LFRPFYLQFELPHLHLTSLWLVTY